ncbi:Hypothetical protein FSTVST1_272 [Faustovirus ST1]|nr:Hypothetical protein FSTVST1_272 [Faustovirus ST1]
MIALQGIGGVVNREFVRGDINIEDLERQLVQSGTVTKQTDRDPSDRFREEANEIARKHGLDLSGILDTSNRTPVDKKPTQPTYQPAYQSYSSTTNTTQPAQSSYSYDSSGYNGDTYNDDQSEQSEHSDNVNDTVTTSHMDSNIGSSGLSGQSGGFSGDLSRYNTPMGSFGADLSTRTAEQERRSHISSVLNEISNSPSQGYSFENEKRNDLKRAMLDEIAYLREVLSDEKVNIEHVESVTSSDSFEKIENVLKILQHMNDRNRYCNMAEEGMLMMAHGFGELFDGKRSFFGVRPDLRGWHNHLNVKLKRMRYDTSRFVGNIMQDYNIGPGWRILLEIIPNLIIYSQSKKKQHSAPDSLYSDNDIDAVTARLNNLH